MGVRRNGMREAKTWLAGAAAAGLVFWPLASTAVEAQPGGFVEVQVQQPTQVQQPIAAQQQSRPQIQVEIQPPAPILIEELRETVAPPAAVTEAPSIDLPEVPPVVVAVPAMAAPVPSEQATVEVAQPAQAVPEPVTSSALQAAAPAPAPTDATATLSAAIQAKAADPALPLPPRLASREREGLAAAYAADAHRPLWLKDGAWTVAAEAVMDRLARANEDGLDPRDYPAPHLDRGAPPADLAEAELKLSAAAVLYARDARGGRLEPNRLGALITPKLELPGAERILATLAASQDPAAALHDFNPRYPGYTALREKLAELRAHRPAASAKTPGAGTRIASATGSIGLAGRWSPRLEGDLLANMERWRWLPVRVADRYIQVNVPEYRLRLHDGGDVLHEARVITGAAATPTPIFSDLMDHAIVNPSWFVPPSILKKMNVASAAKSGYHVTQRKGVTSVRMPPGPRNALGYIKFMFPNDHAVYLHDTPNRGLFAGANRALSHGCVRVEHPFALAGKILAPAWSEGRLKGMIGHGERMIKLSERLPIHLSYFTLTVDEYGELKSFGDIYGYHGRVRRALGLGA